MNNFTSFGQYYPAETALHKLNPTLKLLLAFVFFLAIFLVPNLVGLLIIGLFFLLLALWFKLPLKRMWRNLRPLLFILLLTLIFHLFWNLAGTAAGFSIKERFLTGLFFSLRLCLAFFFASMLTMTTTPMHLAEAVENLLKPLKLIRLPTDQIALMISIALRFIPIIYEEAYIIMKAQEARGADFKRGGLGRLKHYLAILIPLFVICFKRAEELAVAMQIRGRF